MPFCSNCGSELSATTKYCPECGQTQKDSSDKRKIVYDGEIHKCPNCGEVLKAFEINCSSCGHELRGIKACNSIQELVLKLEEIEITREPKQKKRGLFNTPKDIVEEFSEVDKTDKQLINLIKNYNIPNSKEDLLEFMILAVSNVNIDLYDTTKNTPTKRETELNAAWLSKTQQVYEKAKLSYFSDETFTEIENLYSECHNKIKKAKKKSVAKYCLMFCWIPLVFIVLIFYLCISTPKEEAKELERLDEIVVEVQQTLDKREYKHALRIADSIDYQRYDINMERKWDIQRDYWVEKVIDAAMADGIKLEYVKTPDVDNANKQTEKNDDKSNETDFLSGFLDGVESDVENVQNKLDVISKTTTGDANQTTISENDYSQNLITKGSKYTYGHDEWGLYCVTALSNNLIQIEKWEKHSSAEKSFDKDYDVGVFEITDAQYKFTWLDEQHTAFSFILTDDKDWDFKKPQNVVFALLKDKGNFNKGTNYNSKDICYSFENDDWHLYRAIPLTHSIIKIECWYRSMAFGSFHYGYDACVINLNNSNTNFKWTDDEHTSFTISLQDKNNSDLKEPKFVAFIQD